MSAWPKTKPEVRTGVIFGGFWAVLVFFIFILPLLFADNVTMTSDIWLLGEMTTKTAPGWTFLLPSMLFPMFVGAVGFLIGVSLRKNRQLILLGASSSAAPTHLRHAKSGGFMDRWVYGLTENGLDAYRSKGGQV